jgi:hypothetical protein
MPSMYALPPCCLGWPGRASACLCSVFVDVRLWCLPPANRCVHPPAQLVVVNLEDCYISTMQTGNPLPDITGVHPQVGRADGGFGNALRECVGPPAAVVPTCPCAPGSRMRGCARLPRCLLASVCVCVRMCVSCVCVRVRVLV